MPVDTEHYVGVETGTSPVFPRFEREEASSLAAAADGAGVFHHPPQRGLCPAPQRPALDIISRWQIRDVSMLDYLALLD